MVKIAYIFGLWLKHIMKKMLKMVVANAYDWLWIKGYGNY